MIPDLCCILEGLVPGTRGSFCLALNAPPKQSPLYLTLAQESLSDELSQLRKQTSDVHQPLFGNFKFSEQGILQLFGTSIPRLSLAFLADWVRSHIDEYPLLGKLKYTELATINESGEWHTAFKDKEAWKGIDSPNQQGTTRESIKIMAEMPSETEYFFWMSSLPFPHFVIANTPQELETKTEWIRSHAEKQIIGKVLASDERKAFLVSSHIDTLQEACLAVQNTLPSKYADIFSASLLLLIQEEEVVECRKISSQENASDPYHILLSLEKKEKYYFFLTSSSFLIDTSRSSLKERAEKTNEKGINGQIRQSSKGFMELQTAKDAPLLLEMLVSFVSQNLSTFPSLQALNLARHIVKDKEGEVVSRYKADDAWNRIPFAQ